MTLDCPVDETTHSLARLRNQVRIWIQKFEAVVADSTEAHEARIEIGALFTAVAIDVGILAKGTEAWGRQFRRT